MNPLISEYSSDAEKLSAILSAADADWDAMSPCVEWTAAEVVDHVVDTQRSFLDQRGRDLGPRPSGSPPETWRSHFDAVRQVTDDDAFVTEEYDGYFGRTTVADTLANFYGFDLLVHRWDVGRALGNDVTWDDAEMDRVETALDGFGDALYTEGVCKPALEPPAGASRQTALLARMGRSV